MTLADAQHVLDSIADTVIATGGTPDDVKVYVRAEDGSILDVRAEWTVGSVDYDVRHTVR